MCVCGGGGGAKKFFNGMAVIKVSKIFALTGGFEGVFACFPMYVSVFNFPPTTKVIWCVWGVGGGGGEGWGLKHFNDLVVS